MLHTLEMIVKMQTGDVMSGLNGIEDKIINLVDQVGNFSPMNVVNDNQIEVVSQVNEAIRTTERLTGLVNSRNVENYLQAQKDLDLVEAKASALDKTAGNAERLAAVTARGAGVAERLASFYGESRDLLSKNADLVEQLSNKNVQVNKLTGAQYKDLKEIAKVLDSVKNHREVINDELELTVEQVENLLENYENIDKKVIEWKDNQAEIAKQKVGNFLGNNFNLLNIVIDRFKDLNKQFEANRAIVNRNISTVGEAGDMYGALADIQADAAQSNILLGEAQESLTKILANGAAVTVKDAAALSEMSKSIAQTNRATGVSIGSLADLSTTMVGLTNETASGAETVQFITGAMKELGISAENTQKTVDALTKGLASAKTFMTPDELKEYQAGLALIGSAATEAGVDAAAAQELFNSFTDPLQRTQRAAFLAAGGLDNIVQASPEETLRAAAKAVADLQAKVDAGNMDMVQMSANLRFMKIDPTQVQTFLALDKQLNDTTNTGKNFVQMQENMAKSGKTANENLPEDGTRKLVDAVDNLVAALTPISKLIDGIVGSVGTLIRTPLGQWLAISSAAFVTYFKVIKPLVSGIGGLVGSFGKLAKTQQQVASASTKMSSAGGGGGFLVNFSKQIQLASKNFAKISWTGMLKGSVMLVAVAGSLALGIYLLGKAAATLQPTQMDQLLVLMGSILIATALLIPLGKLGPQALMGALAVGVVGAALAGGLALLALAIGMWDKGMIDNFIWLASGLIIATGLIAIIGIPAVGAAALLGALAILAVGAALAGGLSLLGLAIKMWNKRKIDNFIKLAGGLVIATGLIAAIGLVAPLALVGAVALIAVATALSAAMAIIGTTIGSLESFAAGLDSLIGSMSRLNPQMGESLMLIGAGLAAFAAALTGGEIAAFFGADIVQQAAAMAQAMLTMQPAIESIAAIGGDAAGAFKTIGEGLLMMSGALAGGGIMSFLTGDTVANAKDLAKAMALIASPINSIGKIGRETAMVFRLMASGLKQFVNVLKEDAGWFDSFEDNAEDIAAALTKLAKPMKDIVGVQQANVEASIKEAAKVQAEEIRSALAVTIEQGNAADEAILEKLDDLIAAVEEGGGVGGGASPEQLEEARKSTELLQNIFNELAIGGTFGGSVADTRYNT